MRRRIQKLGFFNRNQPLGLPAGSVRAILALLVVTPITVLAFKSGITLSADQYVGLASLVLLAYFAAKPGVK